MSLYWGLKSLMFASLILRAPSQRNVLPARPKVEQCHDQWAILDARPAIGFEARFAAGDARLVLVWLRVLALAAALSVQALLTSVCDCRPSPHLVPSCLQVPPACPPSSCLRRHG